MNKSEVRYALYRAKNGTVLEENRCVYDLVEPQLPLGESWASFAEKWDVICTGDTIVVTKPESDYNFIHNTCLEKSFHVKNNIPMKPTDRQLNALEIVELNMMENMEWSAYGSTWGVVVDFDTKRISTRLYNTVINEVTEEMIHKSAPSDGSLMIAKPALPVVDFGEPTEMSAEEAATFVKNLPTRKRKTDKRST